LSYVGTNPDWTNSLSTVLYWPTIHRYREVMLDPIVDHVPGAETFPTVLPNWDTTARHGVRGNVLEGCSPELFAEQVRRAIALVADRPADKRVVILKSWNEWAEGNYVEPDQRHGRGFLEAIRDQVVDNRPDSVK
jgi:hypothetical protein